MLTRGGFVASESVEVAYALGLATQSEIQAVSGKTILEQALWIQLREREGFCGSPQTHGIHGTPYVVVGIRN